MIGAVNQVSLERANAFLAAVAARVQVGDARATPPAEIGRDLQMPDPLSTARAVRALIARRRLEPASGSYRLLDPRPLDPGEKESIARRPRTLKTSAARRSSLEGRRTTGPTYSDLGRAAVDRLVELGREASSLRASLRALKEEARQSRDARLDAEQRADFLATKVRDLEARAEMAESNLRTLLASARGRGQRDAAIPDSEMEAILGVLKTSENDRPQPAGSD